MIDACESACCCVRADPGETHVRRAIPFLTPALLVLLSALSLGHDEAAAQARKEPPAAAPEIGMLLRTAGEAGALDIVEAPPGDPILTLGPPKERRQPITDLALRLETVGGEAMPAALGLPNGERTGRGRVLLTADLMFVSGGKIRFERRIKCGGWLSDIALCRTECDGSAFALVRKPTVPALFMVVGRLPDANGDDAEGFRLESCREEPEGAWETSVRPRRGSKVTEIELKVP